jgi:crotonobetainyl-CoA:carnitine CoA-transferase CaiB-like acyl-CoA transferase
VQQRVSVDMRHAALEAFNYYRVDGQRKETWEKFSGLYACKDGWVRIHANFPHHRDGALKVLGLDAATAEKDDVTRALASWRAEDYERAATDAGVVVAALRSFAQWDAHPHAPTVAAQPLVALERIGDAPPLALPPLPREARPLSGIRVLDLTRILAGPVGGRTLAGYGADVMLVNSPNLPNIDAIAETSRGKLSTHIELREAAGRAQLEALARDAHVFVQGYRPQAIEKRGFGARRLAELRPGIVCVSLSAYGETGAWAGKRGFDSLVQTATGYNHAEAEAAGADKPRPLPMQILDNATGFLIAFAAAAGIQRQQAEGGSWHARVALAHTAYWVRGLGRVANGFSAPKPDFSEFLEETDSGFGRLVAMRHAAQFSVTPAGWARPSMPPGSHPPRWP